MSSFARRSALGLLVAAALTAAFLVFCQYGLLGIVWSTVGIRLLFIPVIVVIFLKAARGATGGSRIAAVGAG